MAKSSIKNPVPKPVVCPVTQSEYLPWPIAEKDLCQTPRLFRIHRLNSYEWQAYVVDRGIEYPIGKPDLFDIVKSKVAGCMRAEGQVAFIADKFKPKAAVNVQ